MCIGKGFLSFHTVNTGSVVQRAAKLPSVKLWEWIGPGPTRTWADTLAHTLAVMAKVADILLRPPTLTASNFEALLSIDLTFTKLKVLNLLKKHTKNQEASSILIMGFAPLEYL